MDLHLALEALFNWREPELSKGTRDVLLCTLSLRVVDYSARYKTITRHAAFTTNWTFPVF